MCTIHIRTYLLLSYNMGLTILSNDLLNSHRGQPGWINGYHSYCPIVNSSDTGQNCLQALDNRGFRTLILRAGEPIRWVPHSSQVSAQNYFQTSAHRSGALGKGNLCQNSGTLQQLEFVGQGLARRELCREGPPEIFIGSYVFCEMVHQKISKIDINKKAVDKFKGSSIFIKAL